MEPITWITLGYQVPAKPSKNRVYVWRKLKELGAVYFRPGVALLPKTEANVVRFSKLANRIIALDGDVTLAELRFIDKKDEQRTVREFKLRSQGEYQEIINDISSMRKAPSASGPDAKRLARKYGQVRSRDYFSSRRTPEVSHSLTTLLNDMAHATDDLSHYLVELLQEKDR